MDVWMSHARRMIGMWITRARRVPDTFAMWLPCAGHLNAMWLPPGACLIAAKYHSHYHNYLLTGVMVGNKEATTLPAVTTGSIKREGGWVSSGGKLTRSTSAPAEKYQMKEWPIPKVWVSFTVAQYFLTTVNIAQDFLLQREHFFNSGISWQMMSQEPFILPAGAFCRDKNQQPWQNVQSNMVNSVIKRRNKTKLFQPWAFLSFWLCRVHPSDMNFWAPLICRNKEGSRGPEGRHLLMLPTSIISHISEHVRKSFLFSQHGTRTHSTISSSVKKKLFKKRGEIQR